VESTIALISPGLGPHAALAPFDAGAPKARKSFLMRRFKLLSHMIRWRKFAGERFGIGKTVERLLNEVMIPVAETGWDVGGRDVMQKVWCLQPCTESS